MRIIGYARSGQFNHGLDDQRQRLAAAGCDVIHDDAAGGDSSGLPGLDTALNGLGRGDVLTVCSLDRLGQSLQNVIETILELNRRGIGLRSLSEGIDLPQDFDTIPIGVLKELNRAAEHLELERIYAAFEARSSNQPKRGRKHKLADEKVDHAVASVMAGEQTVTGMAKLLGVGRNTLSRALSRRPDYFRPTNAQMAEAERLAGEIEASADRMAQRLDNTIAKIDRLTSPEYIAERKRAIREELEASPVKFSWDSVHAMRQAEEPTRS